MAQDLAQAYIKKLQDELEYYKSELNLCNKKIKEKNAIIKRLERVIKDYEDNRKDTR